MKTLDLQKINSYSRETLIDWLSWNDPNGIYSDDASIREFGSVMSKEEAVFLVCKQMFENAGEVVALEDGMGIHKGGIYKVIDVVSDDILNITIRCDNGIMTEYPANYFALVK